MASPLAQARLGIEAHAPRAAIVVTATVTRTTERRTVMLAGMGDFLLESYWGQTLITVRHQSQTQDVAFCAPAQRRSGEQRQDASCAGATACGRSLATSTWYSRPRAFTQSRLTVRSVICSASAVSCSVIPPKNRHSTTRANRSSIVSR